MPVLLRVLPERCISSNALVTLNTYRMGTKRRHVCSHGSYKCNSNQHQFLWLDHDQGDAEARTSPPGPAAHLDCPWAAVGGRQPHDAQEGTRLGGLPSPYGAWVASQIRLTRLFFYCAKAVNFLRLLFPWGLLWNDKAFCLPWLACGGAGFTYTTHTLQGQSVLVLSWGRWPPEGKCCLISSFSARHEQNEGTWEDWLLPPCALCEGGILSPCSYLPPQESSHTIFYLKRKILCLPFWDQPGL